MAFLGYFRRWPRLRRPRMKQVVLLLLFYLCVGILTDVLFTKVRPAFRSKRAGTSSRQTLQTLHVQSPIFHHTLAPNLHDVRANWGPLVYRESTNSLGFRDDTNRDVPLRSDAYRILIIGDSFAEGVGMSYDNSFVGRVARRFGERGVTVLNAGVASYSPIMYYRKLKYLIETTNLKVDEVVVFLDIGDIEDEMFYDLDQQENVVARFSIADQDLMDEYYGAGRLGHFLLKDTTLLSLAYRAVWNFEQMIHVGMGHPEKARRLWLNMGLRDAGVLRTRALWTLDERAYREYGEVGLRRATRFMNELSEVVSRNNIKLSVAVYPWPDQIFFHDVDSLQIRHWKAWAEQVGAGFLNLFPAFMTDQDDGLGNIERYYIRKDCHWNAEGHRLVAERVLEFLSSHRPCWR